MRRNNKERLSDYVMDDGLIVEAKRNPWVGLKLSWKVLKSHVKCVLALPVDIVLLALSLLFGITFWALIKITDLTK